MDGYVPLLLLLCQLYHPTSQQHDVKLEESPRGKYLPVICWIRLGIFHLQLCITFYSKIRIISMDFFVCLFKAFPCVVT